MVEKSSEQTAVLTGSHLAPFIWKKPDGKKAAEKRPDHLRLAMNR